MTLSHHEQDNNNNNNEFTNKRINAMTIMLRENTPLSVLVLGRVCRPLAVALNGHQGLDKERQPVVLDPNDPKAADNYDLMEGRYYGKYRLGFLKE